MPLAEDTLLENRYRIDGLVAAGGMGAVYRAFDTNLQIEVAIKENYFHTPQAAEQFKREAFILARLRHPSLPRVLQHFSAEGQQYLGMEFIEGPNLWEQIKREAAPFSEAQALAWIDKICEAVSYLHSQSPPIIHRDIKPQNIKAMPDGQAVLVDFGVAKEGASEARTATGARGVTAGFSPPEQYSGGGSSPATDVYALGATLYALLTGVKPPDSISLIIGEAQFVPPNQINPSISLAVAEAIGWAMQPRVADRPPTVGAWRARLRQAAATAGRRIEPHPSNEGRIPNGAASAVAGETKAPSDSAARKDGNKDGTASICPQCRARNRQGVRFCESCGAPLTAGTPDTATRPVICPACRTPNRRDVRFCENCGAALG